jgi:hypothetical protein
MDEQVTQGINAGLKTFVAKYDGLGEEVVEDLKQMLLSAMKTYVKDRSTSTGSTKSGGKRASRRKTGYNLYIRAKFEAVRAEQAKVLAEGGTDDKKTNSQDLMSTFSKQWKGLSVEDKKPFIDNAKELNDENGTETVSKTKSGKPKKNLTGYNLYYKNNKDDIKASLEEGEALMKKVGSTWHALTDEEREDYKARAVELGNATAETTEE